MKTSTTKKLQSLNYKFYKQHAADFSDSRNYIQPGIVRSLEMLIPYNSLLDIGCGNGRTLLEANKTQTKYNYVGIDFSVEMMSNAPICSNAVFICLDITSHNWITGFQQPFDAVACFSVLHHIPGQNKRLQILNDIYNILKPGGRCVISVWQFLETPRLRRKIVAWERVGLTKQSVEHNDYLIDWKRGNYGIRYVHHFSQSSLINLCETAGFQVDKSFHMDGKNDNLGLYLILRRQK